VSDASARTDDSGLEIAVVGMAGRFPGAPDVRSFWRNVCDGVESISTFSDEEVLAAGVDRARLADPHYVKAGGVLDQVERFDAGFFGYSPREAARMDPQHRLFLETAWTALEDACCDPERFDGSVGVYAGVGLNHYLLRNLLGHLPPDEAIDFSAVVGNDKDFLASRAAYKLGLEGPAVVVQTACSTSLVAIHLACQSLLSADCDLALAGGVTIRLPQKAGYEYQEEGIVSPDGHCRAFDAGARGCVAGNGVAVVALRRLADALDAGDPIHAVVKGSAINNDGALKVGYTAPGPEGQARVIRSALQVSGVTADSIGYVEAHGTGTILGDPIEIRALTDAYREDTADTQFCAIGSVKANVGHLDAAAGVTGFMKAVMAVEHGVLPGSVNYAAPNPAIDFTGSPFYVSDRTTEWQPRAGVRRAGVSSFGIGGTNAHVIVEEPPVRANPAYVPRSEILPVSAKTAGALRTAMSNLAAHLAAHPDLALADVARTLQEGRRSFPMRMAVVASDAGEAVMGLRSGAARATEALEGPEVVFMFPGQGSQYPGMGRGLYESPRGAEFRRHLDRCAEILRPRLGCDLRELLFAEASDAEDAAARLRDTSIAQPAIFSFSYSLAQQWLAWGVRPAAMIGHSIGEYVAACVAGVMSLEDALGLVAERGRLMGEVPSGAMLAVPLGADDLLPLLGDELSIAARNAPQSTVVSGPHDAMRQLVEDLAGRGVESRALHTSHAFHSSMMDPVLDTFTKHVRDVRVSPPRIPYLSNVSGTWITEADLADPEYWSRHLRGTVRFSEGLERLLETHGRIHLEVGPGQTLTSLTRRQRRGDVVPVAIASTRHAELTDHDETTLLRAAGALWSHGARIDWEALRVDDEGRRIPLPTYPFQRRRHWVAPRGRAADAPRRLPLDRWFGAPTWTRVPAPRHPGRTQRPANREVWLIVADDHGLAAEIARCLEARGQTVVRARRGERFRALGDGVFEIDGRADAPFHPLCDALGAAGTTPTRVVHCGLVEPDEDLASRTTTDHLSRGFYDVLGLAQALGSAPDLDACRFTVVTSHVHDVTGDEILCPAKATVLGPCRVMPLEYPGFTCTQLDVVTPPREGPARGALVDGVLEVLVDEDPPAVCALRGAHLWREGIAPLTLDTTRRSPLRDGGVYLVTGGLGGVGLAVAEHLARAHHARLALIGRRGLAEHEARRALERSPVLDGEALEASFGPRERALVARAGTRGLTEVDGLEAQLDRLCSAYALEYVHSGAPELAAGAGVDVAELRARLCHEPGIARLLDAMLRMLVEDGHARIVGDRFTLEPTGAAAADAVTLHAAALERFPEHRPVFELLAHCARHYPQAFGGELPPVGVLYGEEGSDLFRAGVEHVLAHSHVAAHRELVRELLTQAVASHPVRRPRLLEIGGGEGALTQALIEGLDGEDVEYHFTDIGTSFVVQAQKRARERGLDWMRFGKLDISRDPVAQGYAEESFDFVLAFNVAHATPDVGETLAHVHRLLAPGGVALLLETTRAQRWVDLVWGLTDGWWSFTDESLRPRSPLLDPTQWRHALEGAGFESVASFPHDLDALADAESSVFLARKGGVADAAQSRPGDDDPIAAVRRMESWGAEVATFAADVSDDSRMREVVAAVTERFGRIDGVIHSALVLDDGAMQLKRRDRAAAVLARLRIARVAAGRQRPGGLLRRQQLPGRLRAGGRRQARPNRRVDRLGGVARDGHGAARRTRARRAPGRGATRRHDDGRGDRVLPARHRERPCPGARLAARLCARAGDGLRGTAGGRAAAVRRRSRRGRSGCGFRVRRARERGGARDRPDLAGAAGRVSDRHTRQLLRPGRRLRREPAVHQGGQEGRAPRHQPTGLRAPDGRRARRLGGHGLETRRWRRARSSRATTCPPSRPASSTTAEAAVPTACTLCGCTIGSRRRSTSTRSAAPGRI
jgi:acyl transferase domain-containing protein/SAM-dependent methyltransferase